MIERLFRFSLARYESADFVLQQKAKTFLVICLSILFVVMPTLFLSVILHRRDVVAFSAILIGCFITVLVIIILIKGYFATAAHSLFMALLIPLWAVIFTDDFTRSPIEAMDTIVLVLALLTFTPLIFTKRKEWIIAYFTINLIIFFIFIIKIEVDFGISEKTLFEYLMDNTIAFIFVGLISYQVFNISKQALDRAHAEVQKNIELNRNLKQSEENYRNIFQNAQVGLFRTRMEDGKAFESNEQNARMFGYANREEFIQQFIAKDHYVDPNARDAMLGIVQRDGEVRGYEAEFRRKDGSTFWVRFSSKPNYKAGWNEGVAEDITEQKRAQEALRESEEKYRTIIENIEEGYYEVDLAGSFTFFNDSLCRISGFSHEELTGMNFRRMLDRERAENIFRTFNKVYRTGKPERSFIWEIPTKDGMLRSIETSISLITDPAGMPTGFRGVVRDITERKQAEEALRDAEHEKRMILDSLVEHVIHTDSDMRIQWPNRAACDSASMSREELIGRHCYEIWPKRTERCPDCPVFTAMNTGQPTEIEKTTPDGRTWFIRGYPVRDADNKMTSGIEVTLDITDRKQADEQIKNSLREKEVMLKEIHHRVKNNMQIISSLLNLQSRYIRDGHDRELLRESQNRVRSMAMVHEKLYQSEDLAKIDFGGYISTLTRELFHSYPLDETNIKLDIKAKKIFLGVDTAIPCVLIINEIVTNAMKYAFPDKREGIIEIDLKKSEDEYIMVIGDNGIGIPDEIDLNSAETLGLQLVNMLATQLGGTIELDRTAGTKFTLRFPVKV